MRQRIDYIYQANRVETKGLNLKVLVTLFSSTITDGFVLTKELNEDATHSKYKHVWHLLKTKKIEIIQLPCHKIVSFPNVMCTVCISKIHKERTMQLINSSFIQPQYYSRIGPTCLPLIAYAFFCYKIQIERRNRANRE